MGRATVKLGFLIGAELVPVGPSARETYEPTPRASALALSYFDGKSEAAPRKHGLKAIGLPGTRWVEPARRNPTSWTRSQRRPASGNARSPYPGRPTLPCGRAAAQPSHS